MVKFKYYFTVDSNRTELIFSPIDWNKNSIISYKRSPNYWGMIRSLAFPMDFVLDAYHILDQAVNKYGFEAVVLFEVEQLIPSTLQYKIIYRNNIDFSKFVKGGDSFSVTLADFGPAENIKANESVKYEYRLIGDDVVNMVLPGVGFSERSTFIFPNLGESDRFMPGIDLVINQSASEFVTVQNVEQQENLNDDVFSSSGNWFVKGNRPGGVQIKVKGSITVDAYRPPLTDHGNDFAILLKDQTNGTVRTIFQSPSLNQNQHYIYDIPFDFDLNIAQDQRFFLYIRTDVKPSDLKVTVTDGDLAVSYSEVSDPSNCKGISAFNLYKRIMNRITPGTSIQSKLINNNWPNLIFTSGDGIREIANAKIKISWKDFFSTINAIEDAAFGFENEKACLEDKPYFFRNGQALDLGNVADLDCEISTAEDLIFNSLKIGYKDGNTDDTDGKLEYNSGQEWAMPIARLTRPEDYTSPSRADQYGIEQLRVEYNVTKIKSTDDTSSDNDCFMLDCYIDGINYRPILGSSYQKVTGVTNAATCYNLRLTPKNNLLRHQGFLRSMLDKLDGRYINFASGVKNTELETIKNGVRVKEDENIPVSSLANRYFMPYYATIKTGLPQHPTDLIDNNPFNYIKWTWKGKVYKGYIWDMNVDIAENTQRELKLLLTADNIL